MCTSVQAGQRSLAALATTYLVVQLAMAPGDVVAVLPPTVRLATSAAAGD